MTELTTVAFPVDTGHYRLALHVTRKQNVTIAVAEAINSDGSKAPGVPVGIGSAICHPADKFVPAIGEALARVRAIRSLAASAERHLIEGL